MSTFGVLALTVTSACGDDDDPCPDDGACVDGGAGPELDGGVDGGPRPDAGPELLWPRELPAGVDLGPPRRGHEVARAIIHLHSPISHDACDGEGWVDGALADEACHQSFRAGLCAIHASVGMITDHATHFGELTMEEALIAAPEDEIVTDAMGNAIASRITCDDGHVVMLTLGSENALMPVGLKRHVLEGATVDELKAAYGADTPEAVTAFHDAGALVLVNHTEGRPLDSIRMLGVDGIEIYNIHANLDPRIRVNDLGLDDLPFIGELLHFTDVRNRVAPDLAFMAIFEENQVDLDKWNTLLAEGTHMVGMAGSDVHENAFAGLMRDGERVDSYRRIMRWFSNHLLVDPAMDEPERYEDALRVGRLYAAFEMVGSPVGFDFVASLDGESYEMGETAPVGATLTVVKPTLPDGHPSDPAPTIHMRILHAAMGGPVEVAAGSDDTLTYTVTEPGAYRAEVWITPEHTRPYLDTRTVGLVRDMVWVYSNPIYF